MNDSIWRLASEVLNSDGIAPSWHRRLSHAITSLEGDHIICCVQKCPDCTSHHLCHSLLFGGRRACFTNMPGLLHTPRLGYVTVTCQPAVTANLVHLSVSPLPKHYLLHNKLLNMKNKKPAVYSEERKAREKERTR